MSSATANATQRDVLSGASLRNARIVAAVMVSVLLWQIAADNGAPVVAPAKLLDNVNDVLSDAFQEAGRRTYALWELLRSLRVLRSITTLALRLVSLFLVPYEFFQPLLEAEPYDVSVWFLLGVPATAAAMAMVQLTLLRASSGRVNIYAFIGNAVNAVIKHVAALGVYMLLVFDAFGVSEFGALVMAAVAFMVGMASYPLFVLREMWWQLFDYSKRHQESVVASVVLLGGVVFVAFLMM
jgi:hypothetical protein